MRMRKVKEPGTRLREFLEESGVSAAVEVVDGRLKTIVLRRLAPDGEEILVVRSQNNFSDEIDVLEQEPPKMVEKWAVKGTFFGNAFLRIMDYEHEAVSLRNKMLARSDDEDVALEVVPVQVKVEVSE